VAYVVIIDKGDHDMLTLEGRIAVITGGNSGIGKATAKRFAEQGAQVIITGRRQDVLNDAAKEIGKGTMAICGDVADIEHHRYVASEIKRLFGGLDIYIANAAVINLGSSGSVTERDYDMHFAINTRGVFFGVQEIAPLIRNGGNIIVTSSLAATKVLPDHTLYAGSKAAVAAFARNWALELRARRIRVNILSPGPVETEILGKLGIPDADRPAMAEKMAELIPAARLGRPEELAEAALFLASDAASFVNGVELHVDGGMSLI
jgi:NAD(P)-dependent dehydrogenase (short-subunit alcohol dehydrogenase family)